MKKDLLSIGIILLISFLLFLFFNNMNKDEKLILIVFAGDSNSGGFALNSSATPKELSKYNRLQIWRNQDDEGFEPYQANENSLIEHDGLSEYNGKNHGWELGLGNDANKNLFGNRIVYLVKTGQGGSRLYHWLNDEVYTNHRNKTWSTFKRRLHGAINNLKRQKKQVNIYIWLSIGINDARDKIDPEIWYKQMIQFITNIRNEFGNIPIFATRIQHNDTSFSAIDEKILLTEKNIKNFHAIDVSDASLEQDTIHWDYKGMKTIESKFSKLTCIDFNKK